MKTPLKDISNKIYSRLVVKHLLFRKNSMTYWECTCQCGNSKIASRRQLEKGTVRSCGCLEIEEFQHLQKQGTSYSSEYSSWERMRRRCSDKNDVRYPIYGGRGIKVCDRWMSSFQNFYKDMGPKPDPTYSIDRIDVNGDYKPSNCRWADRSTQNKNKRPFKVRNQYTK